MVSDIHRTMVKGQEGTDGKNVLVSGTRTVSTTESMLTGAQNQARSVNQATNGSSTLYSQLVYLANHLPRRRGPISDVAT